MSIHINIQAVNQHHFSKMARHLTLFWFSIFVLHMHCNEFDYTTPSNTTEYYFRYVSSVSCDNSLATIPYLCKHNEHIDNGTAAKITSRLVTSSSERCADSRSKSVSVGVAFINEIKDMSYVINLLNHRKDLESTIILLFVSCDDFYMYNSLGPHRSIRLNPQCHYVFNLDDNNNNNNQSDYLRIVEPNDYRQIVDGSHPCYTKLVFEAVHTWIIFLIDFCFLCVLFIIVALRVQRGRW
jgi:hypothetical protein